jgi:phasin family protein
MFRTLEDIQTAGKERFDAATAAATTLFKGFQQIAVEATSYSQDSATASLALIQDICGAKTLEDAIQLQSSFAKSAQESLMARTSRIGELYANLAKEALKPVEVTMAKLTVKSGKAGATA